MAQTEVIRVGLVMISEVLSENLHELFKKKKIWRKRRWWVKNWVTQRNSLGASLTVLKEWQTEDGEMCGNHLRMSDEQFTYLLASVTPFIKKQDTVLRKSISPRVKLQITLRYLAAGDCFGTLEAMYRVPRCTIFKFLPDVLSAIHEVLEDFIKVRNIFVIFALFIRETFITPVNNLQKK